MASRTGCAMLLWAAVFTAIGSGASAQASDLTLTVRSEGPEVALEIDGATRRQVLERVVADSGVVIKWSDGSFANEKIERRYRGSLNEIASKVLARGNFVIVYDTSRREPRMTRVLVLGRSALVPKAAPLPPTAAALPSTPAARIRRQRTRENTPERIRAVERLQRIRAEVLQRVRAIETAAKN